VKQKEFRDDLYYRLNVVHIHIPPLRERPEDVPALVAHFAQSTALRLSRPVSITPKALAMLAAHHWPGNVRELRNAIERAAVLSETGRLDCGDFGLLASAAIDGPTFDLNGNGNEMALKPQVEALEKAAISRGLAAAGGNRREAAKMLGVSLRTLFYKLRRYNLA
jgi:DNA-binding NtrC family response regulator